MLGIPSIGIGAASLWNNVKKGHIGSAIWDGVGIIADGVAVALPGVPDGVGLATKAARLAAAKNKVENTIDTAETVVEVGTAVATGDTNALVEVITDQALDRAMGGKKKGGEAPGPKSPKQTNAEADAAATGGDSYVYGVIDTKTGTLTKPGMSSKPFPGRMDQSVALADERIGEAGRHKGVLIRNGVTAPAARAIEQKLTDKVQVRRPGTYPNKFHQRPTPKVETKQQFRAKYGHEHNR